MLRARLGGIWYYYARSNSPSPPRDPPSSALRHQESNAKRGTRQQRPALTHHRVREIDSRAAFIQSVLNSK